MPVSFTEVVRTVDIGPIETDDEPVLLRVEILHAEGATPPYAALIWQRATIRLHPIEGAAGEVSEFHMFVEDQTIGGEPFEGESPEDILDQIRSRVEATWYIPR